MIKSRWYVAALAVMCIGSSASAQTVSQSATPVQWLSCEHNPAAPGAYSHCNLSIKGSTLKRGDEGEVVGRRRLLRPIPIAQFVSGDSAEHYAWAYRRSEIAHSSVAFAAAALIASSIMAGHGCYNDFCKGKPNGASVRTMGIAGVALAGVSIGLKIRTNRLGQKALDFYNASLGR